MNILITSGNNCWNFAFYLNWEDIVVANSASADKQETSGLDCDYRFDIRRTNSAQRALSEELLTWTVNRRQMLLVSADSVK